MGTDKMRRKNFSKREVLVIFVVLLKLYLSCQSLAKESAKSDGIFCFFLEVSLEHRDT